MKTTLFTLFLSATMLALPNFYAQENATQNAQTSSIQRSKKAVEKMSFYEFLDSIKGEFLEDGTKFVYILRKEGEAAISIMGDSQKGANAFLFGSRNSISKEELAKILPELKAKSNVKKSTCPDFVKEESFEPINAEEFKYFTIMGLGYSYFPKDTYELLTNRKFDTLQKKLSLIIFLETFIRYNDEASDFFVSESKKIYEEIKDKKLIPDYLLFNYIIKLRSHLTDEKEKAYFYSEAKKIFNDYKQKNSFNFFDNTFYAYLVEENDELKLELKDFINSGIKNASVFALKNMCFTAIHANQVRKLSEDEIIFIIKNLSAFENSAKASQFLGDVKEVKIDFNLLLKNPNYTEIEKELNTLKDSLYKSLKLAYVYDKLGGDENIKKSQALIKKLKGIRKDCPNPLILDAIFSENYARFIIKNFGVSNYADFIANHPDAKKAFADISNDKDFNLSKKESIKIKMQNYRSDIDACEMLETSEERKLAFENLSECIENDKNCNYISFLQYVLFCYCEGRNTEKSVEKAKSILTNYIANVDKLSSHKKSKISQKLSALKEDSYCVLEGGKALNIKFPEEIKNIVENYEINNKTIQYYFNQCKKMLEEKRLDEALKYYKEAVEKGLPEGFEAITLLGSLSEILSDDELAKEANYVITNINSDSDKYFGFAYDSNILEIFLAHKRYSALVKYLNLNKKITPFIKDEILAILYKNGLGVQKDENKANELFKKAESLDEEDLGFLVKNIYKNGAWQDIGKSREEYLNTLLIEKNPNNVDAILNLAGTKFISPKETEKIAKTDKLYQMAVHSPNYKGENFEYIYRFYAIPNRPSTDLKKAFEVAEITSKADSSYKRIEALERLATHYLCGLGVDKNEQKGVEILKSIINSSDQYDSAEDSTAPAVLIYCMQNGIAGLKNDEQEIAKLYKKISKDSIYNIVSSFRMRQSINTYRTPEDKKFANEFLNECIKKDIHKLEALNTIYSYATENKNYGDNPEYRDGKLAWQTLLEMGKITDDVRLYNLRKAHHLLAGFGVEANPKEALKLLDECEKMGSKINVMLTLAYAYEKGIGVAPDKAKSDEYKAKLKTTNWVNDCPTLTETSINNGFVLPYDNKWIEQLKREHR